MSRRARATLLVAAALVAATFVVYGRTGGHEFVRFDDDHYIFENPSVSGGLTPEGLRWALTSFHGANWHPLTWISHMLDCEWFGLDAGPHHLVSAALHALSAVLLFLAFRGLTGTLWPPALVAALFAVHPLRVESVAWAAERKDVLSGVFFMLTLVAYAGWVRRPSPLRYVAVAAALALGLAAKPMLVTLPFVLLLLDVWPLRRWRPGPDGESVARLVLEKVPLVALVAASSVVTALAQSRGGTVRSLELVPFADRIANALTAYAGYLIQTVWPVGLACIYPHPALIGETGFLSLRGPALAAALVLVAISVLAIRQLRPRPYLLVGWLWYLGTLVPVIGLVQVGNQSMADRYTYLPLIGVYVGAVWLATHVAATRPRLRSGLAWGAGIGLAALVVVSWIQVGYWRDTETLFERAVEVTQKNYVAHNNLGGALRERDEFERAAEQYRTALEIKPDYLKAHYNLGICYQALGDPRAEEQFRETLRLDSRSAEAHTNLGVIERQRGDLNAAEEHFEQAVTLEPGFALAHYNLGVVHQRRGDLTAAAVQFEHAIQIDPAYAAARHNLGVVYARQGDEERAERELEQALAIDPNLAGAHYSLGLLHVSRREPARAAERLEQALSLDPELAEAHYHLGLLLARQGGTDRAEKLFARAIEIRPQYAEAHFNLGIARARRGDLVRAVENFEAALRVRPRYPDATRSLVAACRAIADAHDAAGDHEQAARWRARANSHATTR